MALKSAYILPQNIFYPRRLGGGRWEKAQWLRAHDSQACGPEVKYTVAHVKSWTWLHMPVVPAMGGRDKQILTACWAGTLSETAETLSLENKVECG